MIQKLIVMIARISVGQKLLDIVNGLHERTIGHRTEILIALEVIVEALEIIGIITKDIGDPIKISLLGAMGPTLAEKIRRSQDQVESVIKP